MKRLFVLTALVALAQSITKEERNTKKAEKIQRKKDSKGKGQLLDQRDVQQLLGDKTLLDTMTPEDDLKLKDE